MVNRLLVPSPIPIQALTDRKSHAASWVDDGSFSGLFINLGRPFFFFPFFFLTLSSPARFPCLQHLHYLYTTINGRLPLSNARWVALLAPLVTHCSPSFASLASSRLAT